METSQGMPSFTMNNSNPKMISMSGFIALGRTRNEEVIQLMGGMEIPSCVHIVLLDSSYPYL